MKNNLGTLVRSLAVAAAVALPAKAALIYETDGNYNNLGNGQLGWTYGVQNTDAGNITSLLFSQIYSQNAPILDVGRSGWVLNATDSNNDSLWDITISANSNYLPPGQSDFFSFVSDYNNVDFNINTGHRDGSVLFQSDPGHWYDASDAGLVGPTGVSAVPEPSTGIAASMLLVFAGIHYVRQRMQANKQPLK